MQKTMQQDQLDLIQQHRQSKKQAIKYVLSQLALTAVISITLLFIDLVMSYSALTGGLIATIASAWFAYKVFSVSPDSAAEKMLASAYMGEIYKIILTGALFICAFVLIKPISAAALLITYFVIHMTPAMVSMQESKVCNRANETEIKRDNNG